MTAVTKILTVARAHVAGLLSRSAAVYVFVLPVIVTTVLGLTLSSYSKVHIGVTGVSSSHELGAELIAELRETRGVSVEVYDDVAALNHAIQRQTMTAGIVVPANADDAVRAGEVLDLPFVTDASRPYPLAARAFVMGAVARVGTPYQSAQFAVRTVDADFDTALDHARSLPIETAQAATSGGDPAPVTLGFPYAIPANLVMFMFLNSLGFAAGMVAIRATGIERRMVATPTRVGTVLAGDFLGRLGIALTQGAVMIAVGTIVFGVTWGNPVGLAVLVVAFGLVSVGAAELLGSFARTPEQVLSLSGPTGVALGMLAGCVWPLSIVSETMRDIGRLSPHAWALEAVIKMQQGYALHTVAKNLLVLLAFAVGMLVLAHMRLSVRLRRAW